MSAGILFSKQIISTVIQRATLLFRQLVNILTCAHCRPSSVGHGRIKSRGRYFGNVYPRHRVGLSGQISVISIWVYILVLFIFHKNTTFPCDVFILPANYFFILVKSSRKQRQKSICEAFAFFVTTHARQQKITIKRRICIAVAPLIFVLIAQHGWYVSRKREEIHLVFTNSKSDSIISQNKILLLCKEACSAISSSDYSLDIIFFEF